jgi:hypothetical protein
MGAGDGTITATPRRVRLPRRFTALPVRGQGRRRRRALDAPLGRDVPDPRPVRARAVAYGRRVIGRGRHGR